MNMKKSYLTSLGFLTLLAIGVQSAYADTPPSNNNVQQVATASYTDNAAVNWDDEKAKALAAGYTEEEFEQMMSVPSLASDNLSGITLSNPRSRATVSPQQAVIDFAAQQLGKPYVLGAKGPNAFDCSGLVQYVYKNAINMDILAPTTAQEKYGTEVSLSNIQPGDLLFFGPKGASTHDAIYIGNGKYIHAPKPGDVVSVGQISWYAPTFARRVLKAADLQPVVKPTTNGQQANESFIFRMYNPNSGLHHYTSAVYEATQLQTAGWIYENVGWVAPTTGTAVYRVYNPNNGFHHYTTSSYERDSLVKAGWRDEGTSWYSGGSVPVYRVYNKNNGAHHYTTSLAEKNNLVSLGWNDEGIAWYAIRNVN